eukprot:CAMPEP_0117420360 /NCGR_PEP_ID=MMETSP0758-20121206/1704_1 /TAXON_ID=63605 /ORGANISM="Percolomonas cosmopolitus, Strain AE-1 (ATCC 50343)" /LENGTH=355 /DNA_ID=CAMNT_0005201911 /DNA_START=46 /DNA_END=1110 /DNA_ORIENTATION=-
MSDEADAIVTITNLNELARYEHENDWVLANDQEITISWVYQAKKVDKKDAVIIEGFENEEGIGSPQSIPTKGKNGEGNAKISPSLLNASQCRIVIQNSKGELVGEPLFIDIASTNRINQKEAELAELAKRMQAKFVLKKPLQTFAWQHETDVPEMVYASQVVDFQYAINEGSEEPLNEGAMLAVAQLENDEVTKVLSNVPITALTGSVSLTLPKIDSVDTFQIVFLREQQQIIWSSESYHLFSRRVFEEERSSHLSVYMSPTLKPQYKSLKTIDGEIAGNQPINVLFSVQPGSNEVMSINDAIHMFALQDAELLLLDSKSTKGVFDGSIRFNLPNHNCRVFFAYTSGSAPTAEHW